MKRSLVLFFGAIFVGVSLLSVGYSAGSGTAYAQEVCHACTYRINYPHHTEQGRPFWMCEPSLDKLENRCRRLCNSPGTFYNCEIDYILDRTDVRKTCAFDRAPGRHSSGGYRERHINNVSWDVAEKWCDDICKKQLIDGARNCRLLR